MDSKQNMTIFDITFKVLMLGHKEAQKTALTIKIISGFFYPDFKLSIGTDFFSKTVNHNGKKVTLQFWDPGGEERFRFTLSQYCKGTNIALFIYDISNPSTLDSLPECVNVIRENAGDIPVGLVGIKDSTYTSDYKQLPRKFLFEDGVRLAKKENLSFFTELSPKTGENIDKFIEFLVEFLLDFYKYDVKSEPIVYRYVPSSDFLRYKELKSKKEGDKWIGFENPLEIDFRNTNISEISKEIDALLEEYEEWEVFSIVYLDKEKIINFRRKATEKVERMV